jgi:hypothetical protein
VIAFDIWSEFCQQIGGERKDIGKDAGPFFDLTI